MTADGKDLEARMSRLEAWVEAVMRTLAGLGLKSVLREFDEAKGAYELMELQAPRVSA
jgi:hypothetical protein